MSSILDWLAGGDLRSDGAANRVVEALEHDPSLLPEIVAGLDDRRDVVRGRAADVLEKFARQKPDMLTAYLSPLIGAMDQDPVPMVRWHLAMLLGYLVGNEKHQEQISDALIARLDDTSVFTISWAIVSLCILARYNPAYTTPVLEAIRPLSGHHSKAVRAKVRYALPLLTDPQAEFPAGWIKSETLQSRF